MVATRQPPMMDPPIEALFARVDSKFTLVSVCATRTPQINVYFADEAG